MQFISTKQLCESSLLCEFAHSQPLKKVIARREKERKLNEQRKENIRRWKKGFLMECIQQSNNS